jgi:hypothetical protein
VPSASRLISGRRSPAGTSVGQATRRQLRPETQGRPFRPDIGRVSSRFGSACRRGQCRPETFPMSRQGDRRPSYDRPDMPNSVLVRTAWSDGNAVSCAPSATPPTGLLPARRARGATQLSHRTHPPRRSARNRHPGEKLHRAGSPMDVRRGEALLGGLPGGAQHGGDGGRAQACGAVSHGRVKSAGRSLDGSVGVPAAGRPGQVKPALTWSLWLLPDIRLWER